MLIEDVTHKVKVSVLGNLPVVGEDVLGLDVEAGLLLRLVVVVVLLLLCLVGVLLVKIVHEGRTHRLLGGGVSCGGGRRFQLLIIWSPYLVLCFCQTRTNIFRSRKVNNIQVLLLAHAFIFLF